MEEQFVKSSSKLQKIYNPIKKSLKFSKSKTVYRSILFWISILYVIIGGLSFLTKKYRVDSFLDFNQEYLLNISLQQQKKLLQLVLSNMKIGTDDDLFSLSKEFFLSEDNFVYIFYDPLKNSLITPYGFDENQIIKTSNLKGILNDTEKSNNNELYSANNLGLNSLFPNYLFVSKVVKINVDKNLLVLIGSNKSNFKIMSNQLLAKMLHIDFIVIFVFFVLYLLITIFAIAPVFIFIKKFNLNNLNSSVFKFKNKFEFNHIRWLRVTLLKSLRKLEKFEAEKIQMLNSLIKHQNDISNGKIVSQIVHDLKSPISVFEELLHDKALINNEELYKRSNIALLKVYSLIENIRDPKKEKIINLKNDNFDFSKIISEVSWYAKKKEIKINCKPSCNTPVIYCDHIKLERCIQNLIRNAIFYCQSTCSIEWKLTESNELYIEVIDDGKGVSNEMLDKMFEWRITNNKLEGTGLGLSYVKFVVDIHQGRVSYFRRNNLTVFSLIIPNVLTYFSENTNKLNYTNSCKKIDKPICNKLMFIIENKDVLEKLKNIDWPENIEVDFTSHLEKSYDLLNCFCIYTDTSSDLIEKALSQGIAVVLHKGYYTDEKILKKVIQFMKK
ncbi:HAMP domain-containing sensor histidine kinase [Pigmentibacter sp. JX0631]|uniref:sensor histidine kinase n=1 Tax=Pigmentibacter sp. JX0631 TaxID=2976982 RepID=UPI0024682FEB|nr:HAMP domain-containing sensor histidine kinase [Pigmentibacter sp. JX0631]WGL59213.1 HAMP domain-containing sensor histidine kinase [Pigmentibacter sp. JX0631]